ncbi:hypothetical protein [Nostoc sp. FACHB-892]
MDIVGCIDLMGKKLNRRVVDERSLPVDVDVEQSLSSVRELRRH